MNPAAIIALINGSLSIIEVVAQQISTLTKQLSPEDQLKVRAQYEKRRAAVNAILAGQPVADHWKPSHD